MAHELGHTVNGDPNRGLLIHLTLAAVGLRDHQRAEYLADSIAADVAGTAAAVSLTDHFLVSDTTMNLVRHGAETGRPTTWRGSIAGPISRDAAQLAHWRQFSRRRTSLWDSHPPNGLRALLLETRDPRPARFVMSGTVETKINAELAGWYAALHTDVLGTRDFRESQAAPKPLAAPGS